MKVKWTDDPGAENVLKEEGVSFERKNIQIVNIDQIDPQTNNVRTTKQLHKEVCERYAADMLAQHAMPMTVLNRIGVKIFEKLGGNHRLYSAKKIGESEVRAYVVNIPDKTLARIIMIRLNQTHGLVEPDDHLMVQILDMIENGGIGIKAAAKKFRVKETYITDNIKHERVRKRIGEMGSDPSKINNHSLAILHQHIKNEPVFDALVNHVLIRNPTVDALQAISAQVKQQKNTSLQVQIIQRENEVDAAKARTAARVSSPVRPPAELLRQYLRSASSLIQRCPSFRALGVTSQEELNTIMEQWSILTTTFNTMVATSSQKGLFD